MPAAIETVAVCKRFHGLFPIEKNQLNFGSERRSQRQNSCNLDKQSGAGTAVVSPSESDIVEDLGVIMGTDDKTLPGGCFTLLSPIPRNQVNESHRATRRLIGKR